MSPKISIAMATYNGQRYIREQLDSLAKQTVLPIELVVCDDGSTDSTIDIVEKFAESAPFPVRLNINERNLGYSDNFLRASSLCKGDWIAFCDQDDVWLPNKIERVRRAIEEYPGKDLVLVGHTSLLSDGNLKLSGQRLPNFKRDRYVKRGSNFGFFCIVGFSMIFKADILYNIDSSLRPRIVDTSVLPGRDHWTGHDQWIGMLANVIGDTAYIAEPLAIWRRNEFSLTFPPRPQTVGDEAKIAMTAMSHEPYVLHARMAAESARAFQIIFDQSPHPQNENFRRASIQFSKLSHFFNQRAELYQFQRPSQKLAALVKMIFFNAYFCPRFYALGWKSFTKDAAFAFGLIGRTIDK